MREAYYERKLRDKIHDLGHGVKCLKWESPGYAGVPDRMILLPGGRIIFVELKQPGKTERIRQRYVQNELRELGFEVWSGVNSLEQIDEIVNRCKGAIQDAGIPTV